MNKIELWKDRGGRKINPTLFSTQAENLAKKMADDCIKSGKKTNKRTQIRKFYDEVIRLNMAAQSSHSDWDNILPMVNMITAKTAYAKGRKLISENFLQFMRDCIEQIYDPKDLDVFANLFEAFYGFYKLHCPEN